eukprot:1861362-Rhodomonas_salina.2
MAQYLRYRTLYPHSAPSSRHVQVCRPNAAPAKPLPGRPCRCAERSVGLVPRLYDPIINSPHVEVVGAAPKAGVATDAEVAPGKRQFALFASFAR